ncbi:MAG: aspartate kinase, partial [Eubacteriaceae bacterium]
MSVVVQKYGGTSVGDVERIKNVADRIIRRKQAGNDLVVVVSAMGKSTDELMSMAHSITENPTVRELDMLLATGEQVSISMLSMALQSKGCDAISFTGSQIGMKTIGRHGKSRILGINTKRIRAALEEGKVVIVAGFQGVNENNDITTLGRGGSDTSAVALAAALGCPCEIYTDVDGIYGIDPRRYPEAKKLNTVSCDEMLEMSSLGAGVMHTRAIELGSKYGIEIRVASSMEELPGTAIKKDMPESERPVTGLAVDDDEMIITLSQVPYTTQTTARLFSAVAAQSINIDMISQTPEREGTINLSFSAPEEELYDLQKALEVYREDFPYKSARINQDIVKLSVVGSGMKNQSGVARQFFRIFRKAGIPVLMITTSDIR